MKLIFFLIAFCLVFTRVYFSGPWFEKKGKDEVTITIENGDDYEQIRYDGKITLTGDLKAIRQIAPGGFIKYRHNDDRFTVTSNLQGELTYDVTYNGYKLTPGERDTVLVREAVREMIAYGFDAQVIIDQLYSTGGDEALLSALGNLKSGAVINIYLERLLKNDSTGAYTLPVIKKISMMGSDNDKISFLNRLDRTKLKSQQAALAYFDIVEHLGSDNDKVSMLNRWAGPDTIQQNIFSRLLDITSHLGADHDKVNMLNKFTAVVNSDSLFVEPYFEIVQHLGSDHDKINCMQAWVKQDSLSTIILDNILSITKHLGAPADKQNMIGALIMQKNISEQNWIAIIDAVTGIGSDQEKSNLLITIARKMPVNDNLKSVYRKTAKTIGNDADYGKAIKAIE